MGERSRVLAVQTAYPPGHASEPVTGRNMTRIGTTLDESQGPRLTGAKFLDRLVRELVEPAR